MRTLDYLGDPMTRSLFLPAIVAGVAIVLMCSALSVFVVIKRLAFVGQGVSHAAFGGLGLAAVLAAAVPALGSARVEFGVVVAFCALAALGMALASDRRTVQSDTAIGVFLVGSMALGAVLIEAARGLAARNGSPLNVRSWDSILFGSLTAVGWSDVGVALGVSGLVLGVLVLARRPLLFWAFDEHSAPAFGVPGGVVKLGLMVLLTLAVVTSMKLAGVVLATALLVLPGAAALRLSTRLGVVVAWSLGLGLFGLMAGLVLSFELDLAPGASIVLVLTGALGVAWAWGWGREWGRGRGWGRLGGPRVNA